MHIKLWALTVASGIVGTMTGRAEAYDIAKTSTGAPVHWESDVEFAVALAPSPAGIDVAAATAATTAAADAWRIGLESAGILVSIAPAPTAARPHANDGVNTIRWAVDAADPDLEAGLLARTFLVYRTSDGVLIDTDIVFNAVDFVWTTSIPGCGDEYDIRNALTHEIGHALGLAHSSGHPDATMFVTADACESRKRDLDPDDLAGLAKLYGAEPVVDETPTPGCSIGGSSGSGGCLLVILATLARRRRPRRTSR